MGSREGRNSSVCFSQLTVTRRSQLKKTFLTCMAVVAVFAIASTACAITCTIDQRPAATLLVPYFQVDVQSGRHRSRDQGLGAPRHARDDRQRLGGADDRPRLRVQRALRARPRLQHRPDRVRPQSLRMSDVLSGTSRLLGQHDRRRRSASATRAATGLPDPAGYLRVRPRRPGERDQTTTGSPRRLSDAGVRLAPSASSSIVDSPANCLDAADSDILADPATSRSTTSNYCNLSNPSDPAYYANDAIGMENNLWGEIIFTSGMGIPTYGMSTVNLEADEQFGTVAQGPTVPGPHVLRAVLERRHQRRRRLRRRPARTAVPAIRHGPPRSALLGHRLRRPARAARPQVGRSLVRPFARRGHHLVPAHLARGPVSSGDCDNPEPIMTVAFFDFDENASVSAIRTVCRSRRAGLRRGVEPGSVRDAAAQHQRVPAPVARRPAGSSSRSTPTTTARRSSTRRGWTTRSRAPSLSSRSWSRARSSIRRPATRSASRL